MIFALLACADPAGPADTAAPSPDAPVPGEGWFAVTVAEEWEGECEFDDPATYETPEQEWLFDPRGDVLVVYPGLWARVPCELAGATFGCDDGSWESGRMQVTKRIEGTFPTPTTVEGVRVIELDCGGAGCDTLQDSYGRRLDFPCRSEAPFQGVAL